MKFIELPGGSIINFNYVKEIYYSMDKHGEYAFYIDLETEEQYDFLVLECDTPTDPDAILAAQRAAVDYIVNSKDEFIRYADYSAHAHDYIVEWVAASLDEDEEASE